MKQKTSNEFILKFNNLTRKYQSHLAIKECSGEIRSSKIIGLRGSNGSGKTTLSLVLAKLLKPSSGQITIASQTTIHCVSHSPMAYMQLSVMDNLKLFATLAQVREDAITHAIEKFEMSALTRKKLAELSRGQLQKFLLSRWTLSEARLSFLDEPFTGLDADGIELLRKEIQLCAENGRSVVISDHDDRRLRSLANQFWSMNEGRLSIRDR